MLRKLVFAFAICGLASYASAGVAFTSNGDIQLETGGGAPNPAPVENIASLTFGSTDNLGGFVDQLEAGGPAVGNTIRSVSFGNLLAGTAIPGGNESPLFVPGTTDLAGVITILEGTITSVSPFGAIQATFGLGTAFVVDTDSPFGIFDALDGGTLDPGDILASYKLLSRIPVLSGSPLGVGAPPAGTPVLPAIFMNTSSVNQGILPSTVGTYAFGEIGGTVGNGFLDNVDEIIPGMKATEGLFVTAGSFGSSSNDANAGPNQFAAYSATINDFAALTDVGAFGAGPGGYNPNFVNGAFGPASTSGDFFFTSTTGTADVIHTIVPEPATYAAFAAIGLVVVRRRRKKQAA
ncbi:MAG: PEP-CTERM sorting domain-containing protein [Planctomycetota bacterium]